MQKENIKTIVLGKTTCRVDGHCMFLRMTVLILCISRQFQFVNVYDNADGICYSADESTDVMIMKTDAPFVLKDSSVGLRKPSVSKCFEAEPMIDLDRLCVSGEDLLVHSSIPEHRQVTK
ncbi:hypothetical protein MN116_003884 [Schistosoma mekongi]|uniref:Uncharacterized protein n=1 Tax=Schistosoma mekongi TaxID=38744 RepID=A0AAE1ZEL4_SCHME|nr:hypothetical protein MN116_003884 [Schistosoma mekongi]